jgi:GDP-4-dehydro-6-deoxy-D-mannose reductase
VLITGVAGFAGSHLADYLACRPRIEIFGIDRTSVSKNENIRHLVRRMRFYPCDILKRADLTRVLRKSRPDRIFHLAGQASVEMSWQKPEETFTANIFGTRNLLEALRALKMDPLIHVAASSEEYGRCLAAEMPIDEETPLRPMTPYAVSKAAQDLLAYQYFLAYKLKIVRTRGFNHTGPRQSDSFVASYFAKQVAQIEAGRQKPVLVVGNTDTVRDFTDVRDMVRGYWLALERGRPGEVYNICSGIGRRIQDLLDFFLRQSRVPITVRHDPARMRRSDIPRFVGDPRRFRRQTGWRPEITFRKTLDDLLDDWRRRI